MIEPWRLALAVACTVTTGVGVATAQTVIVRGAPQGATIEVQLNSNTAKTATADAYGDATLSVAMPANVTDTAVDVFVDRCGSVVRVLLVERGLQPPPAAPGCTRQDAIGRNMVMRRVTTFVVDLAGSGASVHLRQGRAPAEWLARGDSVAGSRSGAGAVPKGLVLFGGGGFGTVSRAAAVACGDVTPCASEDFGLALSAGAAFWFGRSIAAQATYVRPSEVTASGSGSTFHFNSRLRTELVTVGATAGVPIRAARLYGHIGMNRHRATSTTNETIDASTVVVGTVTQTVEGGTQTLELKTEGWGWTFGGGFEVWATRSFGLYGELLRAKLKGVAVGGGEGGIDDHVTSILFGARVRIGR